MKMILAIDIRLQTADDRGYPQSPGLEIRESLIINTETFLESAKVLGAFHDLAESFKTGRVR